MSSRLSCSVIVREILKMVQGRDISECRMITMIMYIRGINPMATHLAVKLVLVGGRGKCVQENKNVRRQSVDFSVLYVSLLVMQSIAGKRPRIVNVFQLFTVGNRCVCLCSSSSFFTAGCLLFVINKYSKMKSHRLDCLYESASSLEEHFFK